MTSETHDVERVTPMDEGVQTHDQAQEAATYDVVAVQDKWQAVWAELDPFRAGQRDPSVGTEQGQGHQRAGVPGCEQAHLGGVRGAGLGRGHD